MKDTARRDSILTIGGLALLAAGFLFGIYFPGKKTEKALNAEITKLEQSIQRIPLRVAELESLKNDIVERQAYLQTHQLLMPRERDVHAILDRFARLAQNSKLSITRLEPFSPIPRNTYEVIPFRISLMGDFQSIAAFLGGMEGTDRLFTTTAVTLESEDGKFGGVVKTDVYFSAYATYSDFSDFNASRVQGMDDTRTR